MPCPDAEILAAWATGGLAESARSGVAAHAASCPSCRAAIRDLWPLDIPSWDDWTASPLRTGLADLRPRPRRSWVPPALAAAGLLLLASLFRSGSDSGTLPAGPVSAGSPPPIRVMSGSAGADEVLIGLSGVARLSPEARLEPSAAGLPRLSQGRAWVEDPGACEMLLGEASCRLEAGRMILEVEAPVATASWMVSAWAADESAWRLHVVAGRVTVRRGGTETLLGAGQAVSCRNGELSPVRPGGDWPASDWQGPGGWPRGMGDGFHGLWEPSPGTDVEAEALIRRGGGAGVSVRIGTGDGAVEIPLGGVLVRSGSGILRIRFQRTGGWIAVQAGGEEIVRLPVLEAIRRFGSRDAGDGIAVQGGGVEVLSAAWRPLGEAR